MANFTNRERWLSDRGVTSRRRRYGAFGLDIGLGVRGVPAGYKKVAEQGQPIFMSRPGTVYYATSLANPFSVSAPAGSIFCNDATFGGRPAGVGGDWMSCWAEVPTVPPPANAARIAGEGQGFVVPDTGGTAYFGNRTHGYVARNLDVPGLSISCDRANFGPFPVGPAGSAECLLAPHPPVETGAPITRQIDLAAEQLAEERAVAAVQAARDLAAAQLAIEETRATEAAEQARVAENAAAQAAAALGAAETYRQIQEEAQRQAAEYTAELAAYAAQAGATQMEREQLAEMRAEVEALRQATADARATEAERAAAYQVAEALALTEARRQEAAETRLQLAQETAEHQAELAAGGGPGAGFALEDMLLYGGLALAGVLLLSKG